MRRWRHREAKELAYEFRGRVGFEPQTSRCSVQDPLKLLLYSLSRKQQWGIPRTYIKTCVQIVLSDSWRVFYWEEVFF